MKNSSIGYHTASMSMKLTTKEASEVYKDFENFAKETKELGIRPIRVNEASPTADEFIKKLYSDFPKYDRIDYKSKNKGLRWDMRRRKHSPAFIKAKLVGEDKPCSIKIKINPKVLTGETNSLAAATSDCTKNAEKIFNNEAERISPLLGTLNTYSYTRIDYCFNADIEELYIGCTPEQMMNLIKRGDIPIGFTERTKYDKTSHRMKSEDYKFYLMNNSVVINCYWKGKQLEYQYPDNSNLERARYLIRFEVQCKYPKVYVMARNVKNKSGCFNSDIINEMVSDEICHSVIQKYFYKTVRSGDYFTLYGARKIIESHNFRRDKETRLIWALELVNDYRSIAKVKATLTGDELDEFKRSLTDLAVISVNPVTIPRNWNIVYIPNLLDSYYDRLGNDTPLTFASKRILLKYHDVKRAMTCSDDEMFEAAALAYRAQRGENKK